MAGTDQAPGETSISLLLSRLSCVLEDRWAFTRLAAAADGDGDETDEICILLAMGRQSLSATANPTRECATAVTCDWVTAPGRETILITRI